jgi:hypothetical protein
MNSLDICGDSWHSCAIFAKAAPGVGPNCLEGGLAIVHYSVQTVVVGRRQRSMPSPEKDRLAAEAMECWVDFQDGLTSDKRKYPIQQFKAFWAVTKRYAELTRSDALIHRSVAEAVHGLADFLEVERKRVPDHVLRDAERLECLLFSGYDPYFEGDEPPGL